MLTYDLGSRGTTPLYAYIASCIRNDIVDEKLACNEKLPSKRALATHLSVGIATIAAAYSQLLEEGFIRAEERRGFFVEDVSNFRRKPVVAENNPDRGDSIEPDTALTAGDPDFFVDLKANRTSVALFPTSVWNRYMREALSLPDNALLRGIPYNGLPELRRAIASYLQRSRGMEVSPDCIVVGAGTEYLYGRLLQTFGPTIVFATEDPGYKKFSAISEAFGHHWQSVPIDDAGLTVDALETSGADVVHISPANHFPTGIVMPVTRRIELFEWANRARKRFIIEDDYDSEFRYSGHLIMPMYASDTSGKVIYLNAFSKTMVPSLRISYMVLPPRLMEHYVQTMSFYSCTVSSVEQYALARFIEDGHFERHINRMRNFYRKQRALVLEEVQASPLGSFAKIVEHNAGTHFLLRVRTSLTERQIRERAAREGLNISMFNDYRCTPVHEDAPTLVLNYAGIEPDRAHEAVARLASIFPESKS